MNTDLFNRLGIGKTVLTSENALLAESFFRPFRKLLLSSYEKIPFIRNVVNRNFRIWPDSRNYFVAN